MNKLYFSVLLFFITGISLAQAPQLMSYQFVVRQPNGDLVIEEIISARISILQGSENGPVVYQEFHSVQTNSNGAGSISIGAGSTLNGSFSNVDWGSNTYFLKSEIDPEGGNNYSISGSTQMLSVPYALYAANGSKYRVGDLALGGIIYLIWQGADGVEHGLVASLANIGANQFWSEQYDITAAISASNGILNAGSSVAGASCDNYSITDPVSGITYDDWYLPAVWELTALAQNALIINSVLANDGDDTTTGLNEDLDSGYWSSTEIGFSFAWYVQVVSGQANTNFKDSPYRVRAIRRF